MIRFLIDIYIIILIIDAALSYFPQYRREDWAQFIKMLADYTLKPIRKLLPSNLPFDVSPLVVILLLQLFVFIF